MDAALLHISKKASPEILFSEKSNYQKFIQDVFSDGKQIRHALARYVSRQELDSLANRLHFSPKQTPSHLCTDQWVKLFHLL
jgi:16S rRNA A1518/A1519 N6-dimethyltransferase RsmA/KsgA/DIM1 with predicted DNA glycosylase/AP lyase activity